jgi:hypothetical protein
VGTTGVIFAAIAIAWMAYLVPHFVRRRDEEPIEEVDPTDRFTDSIRIVRHGTAPLLDQDLAEIKAFEVSTPHTRRAAINDLRRLESLAATRRRRVLLALMAVLSATIGLSAVTLVPEWTVALPAGLMVIFVVVARFSVQTMRRSLDARYRDICQGSDETTVFLSRKDLPKAATSATPAPDSAKAEPAKPGVLWDPVPITMPTYVSKPLAPRTVRTIDLSGPAVTSSSRQSLPVTADAPHTAVPAARTDDGDTQQAVSA